MSRLDARKMVDAREVIVQGDRDLLLAFRQWWTRRYSRNVVSDKKLYEYNSRFVLNGTHLKTIARRVVIANVGRHVGHIETR